MKIRIEERDETKLMMAPMIDMVFLLIIFFMTASHLSSGQNLRLAIPTASRGVIPKERPDRWVVNVDADGKVYSGKQQVSLDELKQLVTPAVKANPRLKVYVRADARTPHGDVKKVMNTIAVTGVDEFIFGVFSPGQEEAP